MARQDDDSERTQMPTPLRLQEARRRGQVARSGDLSSALIVLGGAALLSLLGGPLLRETTRLMALMLDGGSSRSCGLGATGASLWAGVGGVLAYAVPLCLGAAAVAIVANLVQVGAIATAEPLRPDFSRISPAEGLRRMFSRRSLVRSLMAVAKMSGVAAVACATLAPAMPQLAAAARSGDGELARLAGTLATRLAVRAGLVLLGLAVVDYLYQRWQHLQDLKMTPREFREDMKRMEGDPLVRSRRRGAARRLGRQRLDIEVPRADVVIVSPLRAAVAIRAGAGEPPRVVAAGRDSVAGHIQTIARRLGVPVVEHKALAMNLCKQCRLGGEIPASCFDQVAEILAYAKELNRESRIANRELEENPWTTASAQEGGNA